MTDNTIFKQFTDVQTFEKIKEYSTINEMWTMCKNEYSDNVAIVFNDTQYTYAQLDKDSAVYRTVLKNAGLEKGNRVCLLSSNSYDFVKAFIACTTLGITAVILPAQLDEMAVFGCTMMTGAKAIIYQPELVEKTAIASSKGIKLIAINEAVDEKTAMCDEVCGNDGCVIMLTGGTTGKSKGALLSHEAVLQGTINGCYGIEHIFAQRYMLILPLSHVFGLIRNLTTSLYTGSTLFICMNNKDMFRDIAIFKPTIMVAVPALAEMALNLSKQFGRNMLGEDLRYIICGAAAVAPYLISEYKKFGIALLPGYGLTESANLVSGNPLAEQKPESVGAFYPNQEYRIVDGELWLKGKNMLDCYVGNPEENEVAFEDGWFKTGDLVRIDEDGYLYIVGRIKEIIILSNGENISPAEVESKFNALPTVQDSQIFEDMDENGRHFLALEVVPRATELNKVEAENKGEYLMTQLVEVNDSLPAYQRVSRIVIRDSDFERTPSMKIKRYKKCK